MDSALEQADARAANEERLKGHHACVLLEQIGYEWRADKGLWLPRSLRTAPRFAQYPANMSNAGFGQRDYTDPSR